MSTTTDEMRADTMYSNAIDAAYPAIAPSGMAAAEILEMLAAKITAYDDSRAPDALELVLNSIVASAALSDSPLAVQVTLQAEEAGCWCAVKNNVRDQWLVRTMKTPTSR